ncbi:MAG: IS5 family transposase [bacterium]|nr:IS5 family transposase [bacterium]
MPHEFNHARRHKFEIAKYRVSNWRDYEAGLRRRGDVTLWISESAISGWVTSPGKRGIYSRLAIETSLAPRLVFGLALRQTEGFVASLLKLMELDLPVPDHTTLSRRGPGLELVERKVLKKGALDIIVDSTGLRIHGPGEWLGARHGGEHRRQWRKLHLGLNPDTSDLVAWELTGNDVADPATLPDLLDQVDGRIGIFLADGAFDGEATYNLLIQRTQGLPLPEVVVPPRAGSVGRSGPTSAHGQSDRHIATIAEHGRMSWQKSSGYNRRALVEAAISRYKRIIGGQLRARSLPAQKAEVAVSVRVLNKMAETGMPDTVRVM